MSKPFLNLSFTFVPNGNGAIAVFTWLDNADVPCRAFVQSFMNLADRRKTDALIQYVFDSFENFAAQPGWWEGLADDAKSELRITLMNWTGASLAVDSATLIPGAVHYADWGVGSTGWIRG
jgi:hypothetical protein